MTDPIISPADEDAPGEPDRDGPPDGLGDSQGSDELMDPDVLERAQRGG